MADSFMTVEGIHILPAGVYWARRQLNAGIKYIPVASKIRIALASLEGGPLPLAELYSMADCSTTIRGILIVIA